MCPWFIEKLGSKLEDGESESIGEVGTFLDSGVLVVYQDLVTFWCSVTVKLFDNWFCLNLYFLKNDIILIDLSIFFQDILSYLNRIVSLK